MKKFVWAGLFLSCLAGTALADVRIAVVDTGKAFDQYYKTKEVATRIASKEARYKQQVEELQGEYQSAGQQAQALNDAAKNPELSTAVRKEKDTELAEKVQELQEMEQEIKKMATQRGQEIKDDLARSHVEIYDGILKVINDYAKPQGFDLVFDKSVDPDAAKIGKLPFTSGRVVDITDQIIARLNASAPRT